MRLLNFSEFDDFDLLVEANVFNIKQPYGDVPSLADYLKQYADNLRPEQQKPFTKKLTTLLGADDRWHQVVDGLPPDAPEWAQTALANRELVYFKPDERLNDLITHVTHYLEAVVADLKSEDNNVKVFAQRELDGFGKLGTIDDMEKKSQEYFKRGSKKEAKDTEGMTMIAQIGGFKWYILQTVGAFRREGNVMQNCIGKQWTLSACEKVGQSIIVLRTASNESIVAARIENDKGAIVEMKGKNNKPPIARFMPPVLEFVRKKKLKLEDEAVRDFEAAGYFYIDDKLYSRGEAVKKFLVFEPVANIGEQHLVKLDLSGPEFAPISGTHGRNAAPLLRIMKGGYQKLVAHATKADELMNFTIYELRNADSGAGLVSSAVNNKNKVLVDVQMNKEGLHETWDAITDPRFIVTPVLTEAKASGVMTTTSRTLIKALFDRGIVTSAADAVQHSVFWGAGVTLTPDGEFKEIGGQPVQTHDDGHEWNHLTDPGALAAIVHSGKGSLPLSDNSKGKSIESAYMAVKDKHGRKITLLRTKDGVLRPVVLDSDGEAMGTVQANYHRITKEYPVSAINHPHIEEMEGADSTYKTDRKTVDSIVELANKEGLDIAKAFKYENGIVKNQQGKLTKVEPAVTELTGTVKGKKYDVTHVKKAEDKAIALWHTMTSQHTRFNGEGGMAYTGIADYGGTHKHKKVPKGNDKVPHDFSVPALSEKIGKYGPGWYNWKPSGSAAVRSAVAHGGGDMELHDENKGAWGRVEAEAWNHPPAELRHRDTEHYSFFRSPHVNSSFDREKSAVRAIKPEELFRDKTIPDAMYVAKVQYGSKEGFHHVAMLVKGNKVTQLDNTTTTHKFQHWEDSTKVADQLNAFMQENKLTATKGLIQKDDLPANDARWRDYSSVTEQNDIRMGRGGQFTSGASEFKKKHERMVQAGKIEDYEGAATEVPFQDGTKMIRMSRDDQTKYLRQDLGKGSMPGQGWKIMSKDGTKTMNILFVKNNRIEAVYSQNSMVQYAGDATGLAPRGSAEFDAKLPKESGASHSNDVHRIKGAAKAMEWDVKPSIHSRAHQNGHGERALLSKANKKDPSPLRVNSINQRHNLAALTRSGLLTRAAGDREGDRYPRFSITQKGKDYLVDYDAHSKTTQEGKAGKKAVHWEYSSESPASGDFTKPEKPPEPEPTPAAERPARAPRAERAPGAEKKSDRALRLFRAHADENDAIPTRAEFMAVLQAAPFNMSKAGASTYYHNTKKKYAALNEKYSVLAALELMVELRDYEGDML